MCIEAVQLQRSFSDLPTCLLILTIISFISQQLFPFPSGHNVLSVLFHGFNVVCVPDFLCHASLRGKGKEDLYSTFPKG